MKAPVSPTVAGLAFLAMVTGLLCPALAVDPFLGNSGVEAADPLDPERPLGFPDHVRKQPENGSPGFAWSELAARTGNMGLRAVAGSRPAALFWGGLDLDPEKVYRYSVWYRTDAGDGARKSVLRLAARPGPQSFFPTSPEWTQAHIYFKGNAGQTIGLITGGTEDTAVTLHFDDFELRESSAADCDAGNLVMNGDFEIGRELAPGWTLYYEPVTAVLDLLNPRRGRHSLRVAVPETKPLRAVFSAYFPLEAREFYYLSLWLRADCGNTVVEVALCALTDITGFWRKEIRAGPVWTRHWFIIELPGPVPDTSPTRLPEWRLDSPWFGVRFPARLLLRARQTGRPGSAWIDDVELRKIKLPDDFKRMR